MVDRKQTKSTKLPDPVRVDYEVPPGMPAAYANNLIVQQTSNEFVLSFFQMIPPIIIGKPQEIAERIRTIDSLHPECVARVVVARERMQDFVKVMQKNLDSGLDKGTEEP